MKKAYDLKALTGRNQDTGFLKSSASQISLSSSKNGGKTRLIDEIKNKLAYEWKNIYRSLTQADLEQRGTVNVALFTKIVH